MVAGSVTSASVSDAPAWDVVVGDRFIAAVSAPAPDSCTSALAAAVGDDRASIESLVGLVPLGGSGAVESFAIVWWPGADLSEVTAVVRGDAVVDLVSPGGTRRFDARGIRPWHLAEFGDVVALRVTSAAAPLDHVGQASDMVGRARASLRASAIEWSAAIPQPSRPDAAVADADTILVPRGRAQRIPRPDPVTSPTATAPSSDDDSSGDGADHGTDVADTAGAASDSAAATGPNPQPSPPPAAATAFRIGDGTPHPVTGPVLIGRRPLAPRIPSDGSDTGPELLAVASPQAIVSGTHLELRLEGTRLVATDLRSTNGTIVRNALGARRMRAGESIVVAPGTSLDLGDGTIIEIIPAPSSLSEPPTRANPDRQQAAL